MHPISPSPRPRGIRRRGLLNLAAAGLGLGPAAARASAGPIRLVLPFAPGGPNQTLAAILAAGLAEHLGRSVTIENRPSSRGSLVGTEQVARARPDGDTLLITQQSHLINPLLFPGIAFDPIASFAPVALWAETPLVLMVQAAGPLRSVADLAQHLRRHHGAERFGSGGPGTGTHLAARLLLDALGAEAIHQPFQGLGPAREALAAGRVLFLLDLAPTAIGQGAGGALRTLAVLARSRPWALPDVPTLAEAGLPDAAANDLLIWNALLAPAGTPQPVVEALNHAIGEVVATPAVQTGFAALGSRGLGGLRPDQIAEFLRTEQERLTALALRALAAG